MGFSKGFELYGYTSLKDRYIQYDIEGDIKPYIGYKKDEINRLIKKRGEVKGLRKRDFHMQAYKRTRDRFFHHKTTMIPQTGEFGSDSWLKLLNQKSWIKNDYILNYGIGDVRESPLYGPTLDRAYIYIGSNHKNWMKDLRPNTKISQLVLPGAHDAGMNYLGLNNRYEMIMKIITGALLAIGGVSTLILKLIQSHAEQFSESVAVTQKDSFNNMLQIGIRFFDFRPGKNLVWKDEIRHIHSIFPGNTLNNFLKSVIKFLTDNKSEVVFVEIKDSGFNDLAKKAGIKKKLFEFIDEKTLKTSIEEAFKSVAPKSELKYTIVRNITSMHHQTLANLRGTNKRLIFIYNPNKVNDSYGNGNANRDVKKISFLKNKLEVTLRKKGEFSYTTLQLQSDIVGYIFDNIKSCTGFLRAAAASPSRSGSPLNLIKPKYDCHTYGWLAESGMKELIKSHENPIVLLNDFVDVALTERAIALTKARTK